MATKNDYSLCCVPPAWKLGRPLHSWQEEALEDFLTGAYLARDHDPVLASAYFTSPMHLEHFKGSICVTGAVGIGKTTLLKRFVEGSTVTEHGKDWPALVLLDNTPNYKTFRVYMMENVRVFMVEDFSNYIDRFLRDITPSAHIHAQIFYREMYQEIWHFAMGARGPWKIVWDRFPIENIVFAQSKLDAGPLFREFWPTKHCLDALKAMIPNDVLICLWNKGTVTEPENDNEVRLAHVRQRARCKFEVDATDDQLWFYQHALQIYERIAGADFISIVDISQHDAAYVVHTALKWTEGFVHDHDTYLK